MTYDFDAVIDRSHSGAAKWEEPEQRFGRADVIPLWIADMDFKTAPCVVDAIRARAEQGIFGYTWRDPAYFQSIAGWQMRRNGWTADPEKMSFSAGVIPGMHRVLRMITQPGDQVLIQPPVYHPFAEAVEVTGRTLVKNPLLRDEIGNYTMDYADLESKLKGGVKCVILCNPHNPVGRCWTADELRTAANLCIRYGATILSDEVYGDFSLDGHKHVCTANLSPEIAAHTITFTAPSKTFNLAGLQSSTLIFDTVEHRLTYDEGMKRDDIVRSNCFAPVATMAAYTDEGADWLDQLLTYLSGNMAFVRNFCAKHLPELIPNTPEGTYLNWIDARALGMDNETLKRFMVDEAGVAFSMGADYGEEGEGFLRMNTACPRSVLERALTQIEHAVHNR